MAHKKAGGSTRNGRDSESKRLGVKKFGGEQVVAGNIIIRQRGTQYRAGVNNRADVTTDPKQLLLDVQNMAPASAAQSAATADKAAGPARSKFAAIQNQEDAPPCSSCGSIMIRSGACYKCVNCGNTSGCA